MQRQAAKALLAKANHRREGRSFILVAQPENLKHPVRVEVMCRGGSCWQGMKHNSTQIKASRQVTSHAAS
jgi:hypothetical protein